MNVEFSLNYREVGKESVIENADEDRSGFEIEKEHESYSEKKMSTVREVINTSTYERSGRGRQRSI